MEIRLERSYLGKRYTIGHLYCDGVYVCDTIEDVDRGLDDSMGLSYIKKIKVKSETAIPCGKYEVTVSVVSPKFILKPYYKKFCGGKLPRLLGVKGFDGILIHRGTTERDSAGCLIVGYNKVKGQVVNSTEAFEKLYSLMAKASSAGEKITIEILRKGKK